MECRSNNSSGPIWVEFSQFALNLVTHELRRGAECLKLQAQPAQVLVLLVRRAGQIISRSELQQALWGADTHVDFEQGINWCIRRIREILGDDAREPRFVETVPKLGYRFIASCKPKKEVVRESESLASNNAFIAKAVAASAAVLIMLLLAWITMGHSAQRTVLVLPLDNFTGDVKGDAFVDSRTDYLISSLGALNPGHIRVIDRPTAAKFKKTGECIIHIGKQLHADYVFIGSVGSFSGSLRLSGGVFRVSDNTQVWTTPDGGMSTEDDSAIANLPHSIASAVLGSTR
jgi:DNA-binding winged helix-turn-helix (wHTH) protein/TolB-like protein